MNGDPLLWPLIFLAILTALNSIFSTSEIVLASLNKNKMEKLASSGNRKAKRILSLTNQPAKFIATVQVGITLVGYLASAFAANTFADRLSNALAGVGIRIPSATMAIVSVVIIAMMLTYFTLVFELLPKRLALRKPEPFAFALSGFILLFSRLCAPAVWLLTKTTNGLLRLMRINPETEAQIVTKEEIRLMIDAGSAKGTIQAGEKEILHNVFELGNKTAAEIMTHRRDTVMLWLEDSDEDWEATITESTHSFFPVCGKDSDDITGVLRARDYLSLKDRSRKAVLEHAVLPAQLVPTSVRINMLFSRMKKNRNHFAVVFDEYGSMMGIITMRNLLEELVGSLDSNFFAPPEQPLMEKIGAQMWSINDGGISLGKLSREIGVHLPVDRFDTFAGFVFNLLGHIPEDGFQTELEVPGLKIKIIEVRERRLEKVLIMRTNEKEEI
ncbi:MAG: hemolysin family protein [Treponema sp.]|jgi:putative hemolysin|nr:hemolysin family protein [Treponema sp.]